jgi:hypothetical protein
MTDDTLRGWIDRLWDEHDRKPREVAAAISERAPRLPDDKDGAEALRLGQHVLLAHLGDRDGLRTLLERVPAGGALAAVVGRSECALAMLEGRVPPAAPDLVRWGALHDVVLALANEGRSAEASALLLADEQAAAAGTDPAAQRAYAAAANNVAVGLRTGRRGDPERDALMLAAAHLSRRAWERAGNWMNVERADYQLARCYAVLDNGEQAVQHARACLARCEAEGADAFELFFAHEALAYALRADGDAEAAAAAAGCMRACLDSITDPDSRRWCEEAMALVNAEIP